MSTSQDVANPDLLNRIPLSARLVLDVGCGSGALGAAYRRLNPRARILGIEIDPLAAQFAARRLDQVANVDVEAVPLPFPLDAPVDCLIYGDVLSQLRDPLTVLHSQIPLLAADGTVLVCMPNVEHWSLVSRLLDGSFEYEPSGLLDHNHLRWFSARTMRAMLEQAGLTPMDITPRVFDEAASTTFVQRMTPSLRSLGIDPADYVRRSAPLQYVWRARRSPPSRIAVTAHMMEPQGGVSHVRVLEPLNAIATDPEVLPFLMTDGVLPPLDLAMPKVLVLHRLTLAGADGRHLVRTALAQHYVVITEFDDHPDFFSALQTPGLLSFRGVHAVQTTTPMLAEVLRQRNPNVMVFPNAVRALPDIRNYTSNDRITLFFGAFNREADWRPYLDTLNDVATQAGGRLNFVIMYDKLLYDSLTTPHKRFLPMSDYSVYLETLSQAEISFMPLLDTEFNRAKSDLKFIEAAAARVLSLGSPTVYANSVRDGETGVLFRSPEELRDRLLRLVATPELGRNIADSARAMVAEHRMLAYQTAGRIAWYRHLWAHRVELTAALLARAPELAETEAPGG
jgi:SAM-dependent methyltransferase